AAARRTDPDEWPAGVLDEFALPIRVADKRWRMTSDDELGGSLLRVEQHVGERREIALASGGREGVERFDHADRLLAHRQSARGAANLTHRCSRRDSVSDDVADDDADSAV